MGRWGAGEEHVVLFVAAVRPSLLDQRRGTRRSGHSYLFDFSRLLVGEFLLRLVRRYGVRREGVRREGVGVYRITVLRCRVPSSRVGESLGF